MQKITKWKGNNSQKSYKLKFSCNYVHLCLNNYKDSWNFVQQLERSCTENCFSNISKYGQNFGVQKGSKFPPKWKIKWNSLLVMRGCSLPAGMSLRTALAVSLSRATCSWQPKSDSWNKNWVYRLLLDIICNVTSIGWFIMKHNKQKQWHCFEEGPSTNIYLKLFINCWKSWIIKWCHFVLFYKEWCIALPPQVNSFQPLC